MRQAAIHSCNTLEALYATAFSRLHAESSWLARDPKPMPSPCGASGASSAGTSAAGGGGGGGSGTTAFDDDE